MKKLKQLWFPFLNKEKFLIIFLIFIFINISIYMIYQQSVYSYDGYGDTYPNAGLEFFYYLYCVGINPFLFILLMLLMPNLMSYDFLSIHQTHCSYLIETRISKKTYYHQIFIKNIFISIITVLIIQLLILLVIHCFYFPIQFNTTHYPENYYITTQILSSNEIYSLFFFLFLTAIGYGVVSSLLFSLQVIVSNKYIYRCFGVIFGILLILIPALIQGYLPIPEAAFILQINNLTAIGMENVRVNPFGVSHFTLYSLCLIIYSLVSYCAFKLMKQWRERYD